MKFIKNYFPNATAYFFILLFCYASFSKILDFENFQVQIAQSPLLSAYAGIVSYSIIICELLIVILLIIPKYRIIGLYSSLGIMVAFTVYIYLILNFSDFIPCSCGGILEKMGWTEHLIFNFSCVFITAISIFLLNKNNLNRSQTSEVTHDNPSLLFRTIIILGVAIFSSSIVVVLFFSSEHIIKKENNFTRRFPNHIVLEDTVLDLKVNSYYFVGLYRDTIYLGNLTSPFSVTKVPVNLSIIKSTHVKPDKLYNYRILKHGMYDSNYFVYDGSVPVIYRGNVLNLGQELQQISYNDAYFENLVPLNANHFVVKTRQSSNGLETLGLLTTRNKNILNLRANLLTNKNDGGFDSDGRILFDKYFHKVYYM